MDQHRCCWRFPNTAVDQAMSVDSKDRAVDEVLQRLDKEFPDRPRYRGTLRRRDGSARSLGVPGSDVCRHLNTRNLAQTIHVVRGTVQADIFVHQAQNTCIFSTILRSR